MLKKLIVLVFCSGAFSLAQVQIESYRLPTGAANISLFQTWVVQNLTGITVSVDWSAVDNCSTPPNAQLPCTTYNWSAIDTPVNPYVTGLPKCLGQTQNCLINFEINAASGGIGSTAMNSATPHYVFTTSWASTCCGTGTSPIDVCYCNNYPGDFPLPVSMCQNTQPPDISGVPAAWEPPFVAAYEGFITALITHYNSSGGGYKVGYIRLGLGTGGGGVIPCPTEEMSYPATPLTLSVWQSYANTIFGYAPSANPTMIIEGSGYGSSGQTIGTAYADAVASAAVLNGAGFGAESLALHDQILYASGAPCSNDWCGIFNTYALRAPMLGLQTVNPSDPNCNTDLGPGNTCSLIFVLPFSTQRHASVLEVANGDLLCAYANNTYSSTLCTSPVTGLSLSPYPPYSTALRNAASGLPNSTSVTNGQASASGTLSLQ